MPNSLKCKIKHLCHNGTITERERDRILKALEQEPFINKPCVSSGACEHDKNKVLEKIKADLEKLANDEWNTKVGSVSQGLECALEIIESYQEGR